MGEGSGVGVRWQDRLPWKLVQFCWLLQWYGLGVGSPAEEVAAKLGCSDILVYRYRHRVVEVALEVGMEPGDVVAVLAGLCLVEGLT